MQARRLGADSLLISTASAHEATRLATESERLVSTIGTRMPEHQARAFGAGEVDELLVDHVAGLEAGHQQHVGPAGHLRRRCPCCAPTRAEIALSNASGPSTSAAADLPAVGHLAQRRGVDGARDRRVHRLHRRQDRHARQLRCRARCARSIAFCAMSRLSTSVGAMLTTQSVMQQRPREAGHVHHEDMARAAAGAQPGLAADGGGQQFVAVQRALHQRARHGRRGTGRGRAPRPRSDRRPCPGARSRRSISAACAAAASMRGAGRPAPARSARPAPRHAPPRSRRGRRDRPPPPRSRPRARARCARAPAGAGARGAARDGRWRCQGWVSMVGFDGGPSRTGRAGWTGKADPAPACARASRCAGGLRRQT